MLADLRAVGRAGRIAGSGVGILLRSYVDVRHAGHARVFWLPQLRNKETAGAPRLLSLDEHREAQRANGARS